MPASLRPIETKTISYAVCPEVPITTQALCKTVKTQESRLHQVTAKYMYKLASRTWPLDNKQKIRQPRLVKYDTAFFLARITSPSHTVCTWVGTLCFSLSRRVWRWPEVGSSRLVHIGRHSGALMALHTLAGIQNQAKLALSPCQWSPWPAGR